MPPIVRTISFTLIFLFVVLTGAFFFQKPLLKSAGNYLKVGQVPEKADIAVVLTGNNEKNRLEYGMAMYKEGYVKKILISGVRPLEAATKVYIGEIFLEQGGIPKADILLEQRSRSTRENALYLLHVLEKNGFDSFLLITSPAHTRRARKTFEKIIPKSYRWTISGSTDDPAAAEWWKDIRTAREILYEYLVLSLQNLGFKEGT